MATLDWIATASDDTFAARVAMIQMGLCINVANEDPTTANHVNRMVFANDMFKGLINCKLVAAAAIAFNTTLQSEIDSSPTSLGSNCADSDLTYVITGLYNNLSNAYAATYAVPLASYATGIVALAGGGQTGATPLAAVTNIIVTSATAGDSTILPLNFTGFEIMVCNLGAASAAVFADLGSTLNGTLNAYASVAPQSVTLFYCVAPATWISK
jgi:hypothetical protein